MPKLFTLCFCFLLHFTLCANEPLVLTELSGEIVFDGIPDEKAWEVGLSCGGRISVKVEPVS